MPMTGSIETPTTDTPVTTDLTGATVTTGSGRRGGGGSKPPTTEKVDYSTYDGSKLLEAFDQNRKTRIALTALGAINPMLALFGQGATRAQEKDILAAMKAKGIKPPENEGGIVDNITDFVSGLFGKDKEEVKNTVVQQSEKKPEPITKSSRPTVKPKRALDNFRKSEQQEVDKIRRTKDKRKKRGVSPAETKRLRQDAGTGRGAFAKRTQKTTKDSRGNVRNIGGRAEGGLMNKKGKK
jgi:hypothetical protein